MSCVFQIYSLDYRHVSHSVTFQFPTGWEFQAPGWGSLPVWPFWCHIHTSSSTSPTHTYPAHLRSPYVLRRCSIGVQLLRQTAGVGDQTRFSRQEGRRLCLSNGLSHFHTEDCPFVSTHLTRLLSFPTPSVGIMFTSAFSCNLSLLVCYNYFFLLEKRFVRRGENI